MTKKHGPRRKAAVAQKREEEKAAEPETAARLYDNLTNYPARKVRKSLYRSANMWKENDIPGPYAFNLA